MGGEPCGGESGRGGALGDLRLAASLDPILPLVSHAWAAHSLPRLAEDECLALADGVLTPVHVAPVPVDPAAVAQAARTLADRARLLTEGPAPEDEAEEDLAFLLAESQEEHMREPRTVSPRTVPTRRSHHRRRLASPLTSPNDPPAPLSELWDV